MKVICTRWILYVSSVLTVLEGVEGVEGVEGGEGGICSYWDLGESPRLPIMYSDKNI